MTPPSQPSRDHVSPGLVAITAAVVVVAGVVVVGAVALCNASPQFDAGQAPAVTADNAKAGANALRINGDKDHGQEIVAAAGCAACHVIRGVRDAGGVRGALGPPLDDVARRSFIAGTLPNTPENLARFIMDPPSVNAQTAMPQLGLDLQQARDVAAFLYANGEGR